MVLPAARQSARPSHRRRLMVRGWRHGIVVGLASVAASCGTPPPHRVMACHAPPSVVTQASNAGRSHATLSVLTYNIEGLAWPARTGRSPALHAIGEQFAALRQSGAAPDVVMVQEMFSGPAKAAVAATGYPAIVSGPRRSTASQPTGLAPLPGKARLKRGELGLRFMGSGLAIASRYPIIDSDLRAYGKRSCAGFDCLANKGILLARISIPGVPTPVDLYDTHLNARRASRAPAERNLAAHDRQTAEAAEFMAQTSRAGHPIIFGGDFNMRRSPERWDNFSRYHALRLVHQACMARGSGCDVKMSWDGDAPWMDTQDLQFFASGDRVDVSPIRVEAMFDGSPTSPKLSDHDGFLVTYQLSWSPGIIASQRC